MSIRIFVYGTLMTGQRLSDYLIDDIFVENAYVYGNKIDTGFGFPGLLENDYLPDTKVFGEVYDVSQETLESLDILEGVPTMFIRKSTKVYVNNDENYYADVYFYQR